MLRWWLIVACACGPSGAPAPAKSGSAASKPGTIVGECPADRGAACWVSPDGFRFLHPARIGNTLRGVHVMPDGDVWIVGKEATLLRIDHRDHQLTRITVPDVPTVAGELDQLEAGTSKDFTGTQLMKLDFDAIAATSASDVWIAVGSHHLVHWDGTAWKHYPLDNGDAGGDRLAIAPSGKVWAIGRLSAGLLTDHQRIAVLDGKHDGVEDGPEIPSTAYLRAIARQGEDMWVAGQDGALLRSHAGADFKPVHVSDSRWTLYGLWLDPAGTAGYLVASGKVYRRSGDGFVEVELENHDVRGVCSSAGGEPAWLLGDHVWQLSRGVLADVPIVEGASEPKYVLALDSERFEACDAPSPDNVWIVGRAGMIAHHDGKALRGLAPRFTESNSVGLVWTGDDTWLAAFDDGAVIEGAVKTGITGHEHVSINPPRALTRTRAGEIVLAGCHTDMLVRSGNTWTKLPKLDGCISAIAGVDKDHLWAVGSNELVDGKAWRLDHGHWREVATGMGNNDTMRDVAVAANGDVWIVGDGAVLVARGGGKLERLVRHKSDDYHGIAIRGPDDVWIAANSNVIGAGGVLLHWDGKTFARFDSVAGNYLASVAALPDGSVWAVGLGGVASTSRDGKQFRPLQTDTGETLSHVIARADGTLVVAGDYGAIMQRDP